MQKELNKTKTSFIDTYENKPDSYHNLYYPPYPSVCTFVKKKKPISPTVKSPPTDP